MTNPMNNLSKYHRRPFREKSLSLKSEKLSCLHGFDIPTLKDLEVSLSDSEFNDLIDDVTTDMATKNLSKYSNALRKSVKEDSSYICEPLSKDYSIISKLLERIKQLELSKRYNDKEIREKNLRIKVLEEKCNLYKTAQDVNNVRYDHVKDMETKCTQLEKKILEMETFLADYGLVWVGEKSFTEGPKLGEENKQNDSFTSFQAATPRNFVVDYDKILKNISELNTMVNSEETQIAMTAPQRLELKKQQAVPITLYSNGISLFNGPFRPFSEESTRQLMHDILDGYFPSELESRYPAGVPISAIDRRNIMYDAKPIKVFQSVGQTLGGNSTMSKLTWQKSAENESLRYDQPYTEVVSSDASTQLTVDQFLNTLPRSTIAKDGKVIAIRQSIREVMENKPAMLARYGMVENGRVGESCESERERARVKIRSPDGGQVFHLCLHRADLVGDLYSRLSELTPFRRDSHVLVLSYPSKKRLSDLSQTLEECGLVPTASLHIEALVSVENR